MSTALVTGGAGFLGSHIADYLLRMGLTVVVVDDLSQGFAGNVPSGAIFHQASVTDFQAIERLFALYRFQYVYHFAAYAAEGMSHFIRGFNYRNNLLGSVNLITLSVNHAVECFVFASSIAVYGGGELPFREETPASPEDPYGVAKLCVELDLRAAHHQFGLPYVIFRPHNVYGERQNIADPYRNVIGIFMRQVLQGQPCTIFGDGSQTRAFSYVHDVVPVIARSVTVPEARGEIFNIGADHAYRVDFVAEAVQGALGRRTGIRRLEARNEVAHAYCSHSKLHSVFGTAPTTELVDGIRHMADWVCTVAIPPSRAVSQIEIPKSLPSEWRRLAMDGRGHEQSIVS